eukprot:747284-Hanusia_phi.AAC.3
MSSTAAACLFKEACKLPGELCDPEANGGQQCKTCGLFFHKDCAPSNRRDPSSCGCSETQPAEVQPAFEMSSPVASGRKGSQPGSGSKKLQQSLSSMKPGFGGRIAGSCNYSKEELYYLAELFADVKPSGRIQWERLLEIHTQWCNEHSVTPRPLGSIRSKIRQIASKRYSEEHEEMPAYVDLVKRTCKEIKVFKVANAEKSGGKERKSGNPTGDENETDMDSDASADVEVAMPPAPPSDMPHDGEGAASGSGAMVHTGERGEGAGPASSRRLQKDCSETEGARSNRMSSSSSKIVFGQSKDILLVTLGEIKQQLQDTKDEVKGLKEDMKTVLRYLQMKDPPPLDPLPPSSHNE